MTDKKSELLKFKGLLRKQMLSHEPDDQLVISDDTMVRVLRKEISLSEIERLAVLDSPMTLRRMRVIEIALESGGLLPQAESKTGV